MAVAEIIGAAIGVLLLVIVAYVLVGGTLSTAETVVMAQKDVTLLQESRLRTSIDITAAAREFDASSNFLNFSITNNGNEVIADLPHMDVFSYTTTNGYTRYSYDSLSLGSPGTWFVIEFQDDNIHVQELDPGETLRVSISLPTLDYIPNGIQMTTSNGISALSPIPYV